MSSEQASDKSIHEAETPDLTQVFSLATQTVGSLLAFTGILTASGFVIVNAYILSYTRLFNYLILPAQFLAAGMGFMVFIAIATVITLIIASAIRESYRRLSGHNLKGGLPLRWTALVLFLLGFLNSVIQQSFELDNIAWTFTVNAIFLWLLRDLPTYVPRIIGPNWLGDVVKVAPSFLALFMFILYVGATFGQNVYGLVPRMFGGGEPIPIQFTMSNNENLDDFGIRQGDTQQSEPVCILAQSAAGMLVYHPRTERTIWLSLNIHVVAYYTSNIEVDCDPPPSGESLLIYDAGPFSTE